MENLPPQPPDLDSPVPRLTIRYVLALVVVGILALVNQQVLQAGLDARTRDERLLSLVRRQRTLSQKMSKAAATVQLADTMADVHSRQMELEETVRMWTEVHEGLQRGNPELQLAGDLSPNLRDGFLAVDPYYRQLRQGVERLVMRLKANPSSVRDDTEIDSAITQILAAEPLFLSRMDHLADRFSQESAARLDELSFASQFLLALMLATLLIQGGFVFHPATVSINQAFGRLRGIARDLARSEETFRLSFENAAVGMARTQLGGQVLAANPALERFVGLDVGHLTEKSLPNFLHPDDREVFAELTRQLQDGEGENFEAELRFIHSDRRLRWALANASAVRDDSGLPLYLLWQFQDITERHRALESEHDARAFAEAIIDTVREPLVVLEGDLRIRSANRSFYEAFQLAPQVVVGKRFHEIGMGEWNMPGLVTKLEDALIEDQPLQDHEITDVFPGVGRRIMLINARRIGGDSSTGAAEALLVAMEDITERRHAEEALRQSERRYRLMADNATDLITRHAPDGSCVYASPACMDLLGRTPDDLAGKGFADLIHKDDKLRIRSAFDHLLNGGTETTIMYRVRRGNGNYLWFETRARLVQDSDNTEEAGDRIEEREIVAVSRDVTSRQMAEDALRESNELVSAILESITDAFISFDRHWRCTYLNAEAERVLGVIRNEVLGHTMWKDPSTGPASALRLRCQAALERNAPVEFEEHDPATDAWYEVKVYPSRTGLSIYFRDVTERHHAEQMVRQLNADLQARTVELEAINHELEAFSYSVSHDLRAPLRSIDGFSRALLEDYSDTIDEHGRDFLNRVRRATQRMGQLIDALLNLSRVTRADLSREDVDLSALAEMVAEDLRESDPARSATVIIGDGLRGVADAKLMRVVLENLLGNAWKFTSKRSEARIEFGMEPSTEGGPDVYYVRDNGAGFEMAYVNKLFGAFQRLHAADEFSGTGIGLATVQRIIRRHGGRVWAHGEVNKGATIYFTLGPGVVSPSPQEQVAQ